MPNRQSTLILFLLDRTGVPGFNAEKYLCGLVETPQPTSSFSLANVTYQDNKVNRDKIVKLTRDVIRDGTLSANEIQIIGERIWEHLGLAEFFSYLTQNHREVTFLTNDSTIPWDWACAHGNKNCIAEALSCGTVFFEQMDLAAQAGRVMAARGQLESHDEQLSKMKAIILFDKGGHHKRSTLERVEEEATSIELKLLTAGLKQENIKLIDGHDDHAEDAFLYSLRHMREDLGIIHFAGHVINGDMQLKRSAIERSEIKNFFSQNKLKRTLVFINGCESGAIPNVWDKSKNLATAWLDAGAAGMIGCRLPIEDSRATTFAVTFYEKLLSEKHAHDTLGKILRNTRRTLMAKSTDATWLQYTLYGYPYSSLLEQLPAVSLAEAKPSDELRRLIETP